MGSYWVGYLKMSIFQIIGLSCDPLLTDEQLFTKIVPLTS